MVFVKFRPYRQVIVVGHRVHKLSKRYLGPFKLLHQIGEVAFDWSYHQEIKSIQSSMFHTLNHAIILQHQLVTFLLKKLRII